MSSESSLKELHADLTRELILKAAVELMEADHSVIEVTARAAAKQAGVSERTVFRHFATREELLDGVAQTVAGKLCTPAPPETLEDLMTFPERLVARFEANPNLTRAAIHTEIYPRIIDTAAKARWRGIQKVISRNFPGASKNRAKLAAANIRFLLGASTWNYYRTIFGFSAQETIEAMRIGIEDALVGLESRNGRRGRSHG